MTTRLDVDLEFSKALPKCELHAHLSGSIRKESLHEIWVEKQKRGLCIDLEDPLIAIKPGDDFVNVVSFFPVFDKYIYQLCDDTASIALATNRVLEDFARDGVRYLELRTTPRESTLTGMTKEDYVVAVIEALQSWNACHRDLMEVFLILSVDRKMTLEQAEQVVDLAVCHRHRSTDGEKLGIVVGVDLCGNPAKGDPSTFTPAFRRAKHNGLGITVHFAEIPLSSTDAELEVLLSWEPNRLGHGIHIASKFQTIIEDRRIAMELCLSCNVLAKLTDGGFSRHHFGRWYHSNCAIALGTDDVGIFGSPLSEEYLLAAEHFNLGRRQLVSLSRDAAASAFAGQSRMEKLTDEFEHQMIA